MRKYMPYAAMVLVQLAYGVSNILVKIAIEKGLNQLAFIIYRHIVAMFILGPFAFVFERKQWPSLSLSVMIKIFMLSSLGTTIHLNVYYTGLAYTTPTVAGAMSNVIPGLTFVIAVLLRMEKVSIWNSRGQAKVLGTIACIVGSLVFTFWKGGYKFKAFVDRPLIEIYDTTKSTACHRKDNWIKGSVLILTSEISWSVWLILQAVVYKIFPARLSMNVLICFFASLQSSILAIFFSRSTSLWRMEWNVRLWTILYSGVVISGLVSYLQTWCISKNGPVFAAMFSPLLLVITAIFSGVVFGEHLHLGSLIGALLIILGLYCVLWGKTTDNATEQKCENTKGNNGDQKV